MIVNIRVEKLKFKLFLPTSLLKSRFIVKRITGSENDSLYIKNLYRTIKKYIKENGHFTLLELRDGQDNTYITIRV